MINPSDLKQKLGEHTEELESIIGVCYSSLEAWQRGLLLIALTLFLLFAIYYLIKPDKTTKLSSKKEKEIEEKLMRQMAFFKRLKE